VRYIPFVGIACMCGAGFLALAQISIINVDVTQEAPGSEPAHFLGMVGHWVIGTNGARNVLMEDGAKWKQGEPAAGLAEKARTLYGAGHEAFLKSVNAFPLYPFAVARGVDDFKNGVVWVRFQLVDGSRDQSAGILFNLKPNGDYLVMEYNGGEAEKGKKEESHRLRLWSFAKGAGKLLKSGSEELMVLPKQWAYMQITVDGTVLVASVGNRPLLDYTLAEPVSGRVGVWTKSDGVTYFDDYKVAPK
jgi:hypothetical protein